MLAIILLTSTSGLEAKKFHARACGHLHGVRRGKNKCADYPSRKAHSLSLVPRTLGFHSEPWTFKSPWLSFLQQSLGHYGTYTQPLLRLVLNLSLTALVWNSRLNSVKPGLKLTATNTKSVNLSFLQVELKFDTNHISEREPWKAGRKIGRLLDLAINYLYIFIYLSLAEN